MMRTQFLRTSLIVIAIFGAVAASADQCVECHKSPLFRVQHKTLFDYYVAFEQSVHGVAGLSCSDCHGGDTKTEDPALAHIGVVENVRYDKVPATCGECHVEEHDSFVGSKHYQIMSDNGTAPNCVTCHGAMEMDFIFVSKVRGTCTFCHNVGSGNAPEVPDHAEYILSQINIIKGYKHYVETYSKDRELVAAIDESYDRLSSYWHRFDFEEVAVESTNLLGVLREAKAQAMRDRRK